MERPNPSAIDPASDAADTWKDKEDHKPLDTIVAMLFYLEYM